MDQFETVDQYALEPDEFYALDEAVEETDQEEIDWLSMARDAYETSNNFFDSSVRKQVEKNIDLFNSRHVSGSKYASEAYKYRSKIFRPKTRSSVRRHEASAATAYFSTNEVVKCQAANQNDKVARLGATIGENLVNARLAEPSFFWFQTAIGAYQDAMVQGCVISRQTWYYRAPSDGIDIDADDRAEIKIIPIENFRFSPAADWRDPINTSPYLIEMMPMYRQDVKERMTVADEKTGEPPWNMVSDEELSSGNKTGSTDSTRSVRNNSRQDGKDIIERISDYDIIWVHRNIIKKSGVDYLYYTLGTTAVLSDPVPLKTIVPVGRDYVMGFCNLETHKTIPAGTVELTAGIQQEANDIANQRLDNVKLVVNRRSFVNRNAQIDVRSLTKSVPGGVTLVNDINKDVRYDAPPDVTGSSYQEQDRLNNDFDELSGAFSGSSVSSNRAMNETVGGMELMQNDSNSVTAYQLRIFSETWMKPTLRQILELEKWYESDPIRLSAAGEGIDPNEAIKALQKNIVVGLSVGFGATNPQKQVEKLAFGLGTIAKFMPQTLQLVNVEEVLGEVFGALGYQDGKRFFNLGEEGEDPQVAQLKQIVQQLQQQLQGKQAEIQAKGQIEQIKQQGMSQREMMKQQANLQLAQMQRDIDYIDEQIKAEMNDIKRGDLIVQRDAFEYQKKHKELELSIAERDKMSDVLARDQYGMIPGRDDIPGKELR